MINLSLDNYLIINAIYTLLDPFIQIDLPIPHAVAAQLYERDSPALTSPLRQRLHGKTCNTRHIFGPKQAVSFFARLWQPWDMREFYRYRHCLLPP